MIIDTLTCKHFNVAAVRVGASLKAPLRKSYFALTAVEKYATYVHNTTNQHKILKFSKEKYPPASNHRQQKRDQRIDHVRKQQIISSCLCAIKRFVAFPSTELTGQRHCKRQNSNLQSPHYLFCQLKSAVRHQY